MNFGDFFRHIRHIGRFVAASAFGLWRKEGRIGLDQEMLKRNGGDHLAALMRIFEGDGSSYADHETLVDGFLCRFSAAAEGV